MCSKIDSKKKIDKNFVTIIKLLNKNNIHYWLCHGTLLGIIRDKKLIPWDHDIDVAVWKDNHLKKKFEFLMKKKNFLLKDKYSAENDLITFTRKGGREVDINFYEKKKINSREIAFIRWYVPKNFFMKIIDALSFSSKFQGKFKILIRRLHFMESIFKMLKNYLIKKNLFYKILGYTQPLRLLKKLKQIQFEKLEVSVPFYSEKYLEYVYGKDWKKPIKKFNWIKDSPSTKDIKSKL